MGWSIGKGADGRDIGYGVPAICDQPECSEKIDRGISYCCGGYVRSDEGCGLYFCFKHLRYGEDGSGNSAEFCAPCLHNLSLPEDAKYPDDFKPRSTRRRKTLKSGSTGSSLMTAGRSGAMRILSLSRR